ncbi:hypothetical protein J3B02_003581, partial [Coemansia erecta]
MAATPGTAGKGTADVWDFDAPQFYDFANSKTPGPSADKWFDHAHPTPAPKKTKGFSRLSRLSFLSTDSRESLLPNRPSLSPSRVRVERNGRLTIESDFSLTKDIQATSTAVVENVEFSDTDDEIEFNKWKRQHSLPEDDSSDKPVNAESSDKESKCKSKSKTKTAVATLESETSSLRDRKDSINQVLGPNSTSLPALPVKTAGSKVAKKTATTIVRKSEKAAAESGSASESAVKKLTVPIEQCGFMRPTKVATRRLSAKKRDKANQQMIAEMIAKSVNSMSSQESAKILTVPKPFHFQGAEREAEESTKTSIDEFEAVAAEAAEAAAAAEEKKKQLSRKAQENLIHKLTTKRRASENSNSKVDNEEPQKDTTPKKPSIRKAGPTVPKTPQFAKSKRSRSHKEPLLETSAESAQSNMQSQNLEKKAARIMAKIKAGSTGISEKLAPPKPTVPRPFVFRSDAVAERHLQRLREEIANLKAEEEALRQFRANPLPDFPTPKRRKRQQSQPLHASPFQLETD